MEDSFLHFIFKGIKQEAELQGELQQNKLNEAGEDLMNCLGKDSSAAAEVTKQMQEVDSCRKNFLTEIDQRLEKVRTRDLLELRIDG